MALVTFSCILAGQSLFAAVESLPLATRCEGAGGDVPSVIIHTRDVIEARHGIRYRIVDPEGGLCVVELQARRADEGVAWKCTSKTNVAMYE